MILCFQLVSLLSSVVRTPRLTEEGRSIFLIGLLAFFSLGGLELVWLIWDGRLLPGGEGLLPLLCLGDLVGGAWTCSSSADPLRLLDSGVLGVPA